MIFVATTVLSINSINLPQDVLFGFSQDPEKGGADYNAPLRAYIGRQQTMIVAELLSADKLGQIAENDFKVKGSLPRYTLSNHYNLICTNVFSELSRSENITPLRRDLQRYVVEQLIRHSESTGTMLNSDAILLSNDWLEKLHGQFTIAAKNPKLDQMTKLHVKDLAKKIGQAMEPTEDEKR